MTREGKHCCSVSDTSGLVQDTAAATAVRIQIQLTAGLARLRPEGKCIVADWVHTTLTVTFYM